MTAELPEITFSVPSIRINTGSTLNIEAEVKNAQNSIFSWTKDGRELPSYALISQNRVVIQNASTNDAGYYELSISGTTSSVSKGVNVYVEDTTTKRPQGS